MTRAFVGCLALACACTNDDVRSPAAATSTAAPSAERPSVPTPTESTPPVGPVAKDDAPKGAPPLTVVQLAPASGELAELLATAASRARADGRVPVVEMGASWCPPCKKLDALLGNSEFTASLSGIALLQIDSDEWGEALDEAGFRARTIPAFYVVDAGGKPKGEPLSGAKWGTLDADAIAEALRGLAR